MARIGFVAALFNRGLSEVSRTLADAMSALGHEPFWFVREGMVYGQPMRERFGRWALPNRTEWPRLEIQPPALVNWAQYYGLTAVVLNEEHEWPCVMALHQAGIKTIQYMDAYLSEAERPYYRFLDQLWCVTRRTEAILHKWKQGPKTHHIGWGVREWPEQPAPRYQIHHSAGWLGLGMRKGTDLLLNAMDVMRDDPPEVLIHCQLPLELALKVMGRERLPAHVVWEDGDHEPPGLHGLGRVSAQVSRIEGFGLSVVESMICGRPCVTIDSAPMNEFVNASCGWLVSPQRFVPHVDGSCYEAAVVNAADVAKILRETMNLSDAAIEEKAQVTRNRARDLFDWERFQLRLAQGLERLAIASG